MATTFAAHELRDDIPAATDADTGRQHATNPTSNESQPERPVPLRFGKEVQKLLYRRRCSARAFAAACPGERHTHGRRRWIAACYGRRAPIDPSRSHLGAGRRTSAIGHRWRHARSILRRTADGERLCARRAHPGCTALGTGGGRVHARRSFTAGGRAAPRAERRRTPHASDAAHSPCRGGATCVAVVGRRYARSVRVAAHRSRCGGQWHAATHEPRPRHR